MHTIESDGDIWEKRFHPRLFPLFPNYDEFWHIVIVPMTMRDINRGINLLPGVDRDLELLAMSHYSCYYHLGVANELLDSLDGKPYLYEDFFFHLATGCEMIANEPKERFLAYCRKVWEKTGMLLERQRLESKLGQNWMVKKEAFDEMADEVRLYRNAIAHNPKLAQVFDEKSQKLWIPDKSALEKNNNMAWSDVSVLMPVFPLHFIERDRLARRLLTEVLSSINALWPELIGMFKYLMTLDVYRDLIPTSVRPSEVGFVGDTTGSGVRYPGMPPNDGDAYSSASGTSYRPSLNDL